MAYLLHFLQLCYRNAMNVISVVNLKGGSAKTTSTIYLAHAFAAMGMKVLVVDADPQGSSLSWSDMADFPFTVVAMPVKNLHRKLSGVLTNDYDIVMIDTPPLEEQGGIVHSALRISDLAIITLAPTAMEYIHLERVWDALDDVATLRSDDQAPPAVVLLNRTVANARSTQEMTEELVSENRHVLETSIPRRESIGQAFGSSPKDLAAYRSAAEEIRDRYMEVK